MKSNWNSPWHNLVWWGKKQTIQEIAGLSFSSNTLLSLTSVTVLHFTTAKQLPFFSAACIILPPIDIKGNINNIPWMRGQHHHIFQAGWTSERNFRLCSGVEVYFSLSVHHRTKWMGSEIWCDHTFRRGPISHNTCVDGPWCFYYLRFYFF